MALIMFHSTHRHVIAVRGAAAFFPNQFQQPVHRTVRAAAVRPGNVTLVHAASPEHQHEDIHALQDRHGQPGGWDGVETRATFPIAAPVWHFA